MNSKIIGIIPARYASTRFPGKPLADVLGKPMIQRVYEQAMKALPFVFVATDDKRIEEAVMGFNGKVIQTSTDHQSGTDRIAEAVRKITNRTDETYDIVVNIQGDEPFILPEQLKLLVSCFTEKTDTQIATLVRKVTDNEDIFNENYPKVVLNCRNEALYFSRSPIPFLRNKDRNTWATAHTYYKHLGIYAYRTDVLEAITRLEPSSLELAESLEQNRWLENGYKITVAVTDQENLSVDTPEDLEKIIRQYGKEQK
ncbi:MAG TPA: 3-deoxy-manno-octulosonate cytidylyltransferase [Bacteroidales bacterium]|nr:3-deoxy-manno-octulosonate cytidylyltransferase [Bacteroidales bacterium]